jgi:hypothetical protein
MGIWPAYYTDGEDALVLEKNMEKKHTENPGKNHN